MNTVFQKYAAALLPFFILVIGASQTVLGKGFDLQVIVPFAIIVLGAIATFIVKLIPGKWQGGLKTGVAIAATILSAVVPFLLPSGFSFSANAPIVIVAILNALATELGVQIRIAPNETHPALVPVAPNYGVYNITAVNPPAPITFEAATPSVVG